MEDYPLISEYKEAIMSPEDNFSELTSLRPVLDSRGEPVMSSGNFAVVFKMRDEKTGKLYAIKCFTRSQEGRAESYRRITEELESVASAYMIPMRWLDNELFVDTTQCDREEFPVVVMDWVEGEPLDLYVSRHLDDTDVLSMLSYRFNRMAAWLLAQPFAHGDLKPDNIFVRPDGTLTLIDYDSMFVPSMQGEKARETGNPDYYNPMYTDDDFNEHIDDFSVVVIALSLKALSLNPSLKYSAPHDTLLLTEADFLDHTNSQMLKSITLLSIEKDFTLLLGTFYIMLATKSLDLNPFELLTTEIPNQTEKSKNLHKDYLKDKDTPQGLEEELSTCKNRKLSEYTVKAGTTFIADSAFKNCTTLQSITIPPSVTKICSEAFRNCTALQSIVIPSSVTDIDNGAFRNCTALQSIVIPPSVLHIGDEAFRDCTALQSIVIPSSVLNIGDEAFRDCTELQSITIPSPLVTHIGKLTFYGTGLFSIGKRVFYGCEALKSITIPSSVTAIGDSAFYGCKSLQSVDIPSSVTHIGKWSFCGCEALDSITIPSSVTVIGESAFYGCKALQKVRILSQLTYISNSTFYKCRSLQDINIPSSVIHIGNWAFFECDTLTNLTLWVESIGDYTFWKCKSFKSVKIKSTTIRGRNTFPCFKHRKQRIFLITASITTSNRNVDKYKGY